MINADSNTTSLNLQSVKFLIVGAGLFGCTMAERIANNMKCKVVVIDKKDHIGGNSYSEIEPRTGIEYHKYGSHIFHTKSQKVWRYINNFSSFNNYRHRVFSSYKGRLYLMPINLVTINKFYGMNMTAEQAKRALFPDFESENPGKTKSLSDTQLSDFGKPLYEVFIEGYTAKQWGIDPEELPRETINRLPIRFDRNSDYFDDPWQGIPIDGYGNLARKMLDHVNIDVFLGIDYFEIKYFIPKSCHIIYTGPIDRFFDYRFGALKWRSVRFEQETLPIGDYQGTAVINFPEADKAHTRIHEYRHYHPERSYPGDRTIIAREFPVNSFGDYNPTYPVNTKKDKEIFEAYKKEQQSVTNITFGGRLGTYSYLNMDETILNALQTYERLKEARKG